MPHTPGPWTWPSEPSASRADGGETILGNLQSPDGGSVLHIDYCDHVISAYEFADARLIAAAPEMYELLKELEWMVWKKDTLQNVCAICKNVETHSPDCRLAAVLKAVEGEA
jgi:hypothetical protein